MSQQQPQFDQPIRPPSGDARRPSIAAWRGGWRCESCLLRFCVALTLVTAAAATLPGATAGWEELSVDHGGTTAIVYIPSSLDQSQPAPCALFFHGLGASIADYADYLAPSAETASLVLILVQSEDASGGWSSQDIPAVNDAIAQVQAQLNLDPQRLSMSGHSAGGAFAYLLAYSETGVNAIFTLSAPAYPVSAVTDPDWIAPILMCYGSLDPNYTGGSEAALVQQWQDLGIPYQVSIGTGYDHDTIVSDSAAITAGFQFLVGQRDPSAGSTTGTGTTTGTGSGTATGTGTGTGTTTGTASGTGSASGTTGSSAGTGGGGSTGAQASSGGGGHGCGLGGSVAVMMLLGIGRLRSSGRATR
jgi:predicted esterase